MLSSERTSPGFDEYGFDEYGFDEYAPAHQTLIVNCVHIRYLDREAPPCGKQSPMIPERFERGGKR